MQDHSPWIREITAENFQKDVADLSLEVPVVVDFWAPWCGPCRELTPLLEGLVQEHRGAFVLAKVNVDENQELAGAFGIQSIPLVVAFRDGQVVDNFQGVLPEAELRQWVQGLLPSRVEQLLQQGQEIEDQDPTTAEGHFREALEADAKCDPARIALARVLLAQNRFDESREFIEHLERRGYLEPEAEQIKSQLDLLADAEEAGGVAEARKAAEASPENPRLQLKLAEALAVGRKFEEAFEICLTLIEQDTDGIAGEAKENLLKMFDVAGPATDLVNRYRRRLATLLY